MVFLAAALYFASGSSQAVTNYPSKNSGVVVFGDSLVEGVGATQKGGFVTQLSKELGLPIANLGIRGDTTLTALSRVNQIKQIKPALTVVLLGGNDFLQRVSEEETRANLETLIKAIHESGSAVLLIGIEAVVPGALHGQFFKELAQEFGTAYVPDILGGIFGKPSLMSDGLHPNDAGYRIMADKIKPVLRELVK